MIHAVYVDVSRLDAPQPAGFWIRAVAAALDFAFIFTVQFSLGFVARRIWGAAIEVAALLPVMVGVFTMAFTVLYATLLHALPGQTLGKMVVGVRVVATDGAPLGVGAALLRYLAYFLSAAAVGLGFLMAGLRRDKRALHDLLAGSRVERPAVPHRTTPRVPGPSEAIPRVT